MKNLKLGMFIFLVLALILAPILSACAPEEEAPPEEEEAPPPVEPIELEFAAFFVEGTSIAQAYEWWASEIENRT
ncbi:unnamed protein product, partial [marine sediment metagenome]